MERQSGAGPKFHRKIVCQTVIFWTSFPLTVNSIAKVPFFRKELPIYIFLYALIVENGENFFKPKTLKIIIYYTDDELYK